MAELCKVIENQTLQEKLHYYRVYPGMDLFILPRPGYRKKYAIFSTRFGSIDNRFRLEGEEEIVEVPDGMAHFLEHKLFEDSGGNVFDRFAALGASANAYTSFTQTTYLFSCTANFEENLAILLDFVQEPYFTPQTVAKEQGIIGQEIKMYEDHPHWRVFFNLLEALYREHPVRNDIAGTLDSIAGITPELLYRCYNPFYHPGNMAVFIVGDLAPEQVALQVEKNLGRRDYKPINAIERIYPREPHAVTREKTVQELVVSEPIFFLGFKDVSMETLQGSDLVRREILMEIILDIIFGSSEELYNDLYRRDLIDDNFGAEYTAEINFGYIMIGGASKDPDQLYDRIITAIASAKRDGLSAEQFERHRRKVLGGYIRRFNSLEFIANNFLAYHFRSTDLFEIPAILQDIRRQEAGPLLEDVLDLSRHAVSIILPVKEN